jgi:GTP-binding protein
MIPTVAIVGRANVGKSTLFNRLAGRRLALVDDTPGLTRDRREADARLAGQRFRIVDTAGFEAGGADTLTARMRAQTETALLGADIVFFVVDARAGVTPLDVELADLVRRSGKPVVLIANKAEGRQGEVASLEAYKLGLGDPVTLSAEHGEGIGELREALAEAIDALEALATRDDAQAAPSPATPPAGLPAAPPAVSDEEGADVGAGDVGASDVGATDVGASEASAAPGSAVISPGEPDEGEDDGGDSADDPARPIKVAVIGRPNVGKSTLVNRLLGEERLLTGPEAGVTRDAITVDWSYNDRNFRLVDTAGLRRKAKVVEKLEKLATGDAIRALKFAEIVIAVFDATQPFEKQDLQLVDLAEREGRGLVIALDKWDLVSERDRALGQMREAAERLLPQIAGVRVVPVSGLTGYGLDRLMAAVIDAHAGWSARVPTGRLNRWLEAALARHPPPAPGGRRLKIRYVTQVKTRPPTFAAFCSRPEELPAAYQRYLVNSLRETFELSGVPIRLLLRKPDNPYAGRR